jgi:hypothetical protein
MTRWMIVGILGSGPLDEPVAVGPYTSERAAERDTGRLERAVAYSEGEGAPIFEVVEITPVRRVGLLLIDLGRDWGEPG